MSVFIPIVSGLIAALVVYLLSTFVSDQPSQIGNRHYVVYGAAFKILAAAFFPVCAFVTYAMLRSSPDQRVMAIIVAVLFWFGTFYLAYEFFFVRLSYDHQFIYHWSPIKRARKIPWSAVKDVQYSGVTQSFIIKTDGYGAITVSPYANGCRAFVDQVGRKLGYDEPPVDVDKNT